jgi:hypothetical protein
LMRIFVCGAKRPRSSTMRTSEAGVVLLVAIVLVLLPVSAVAVVSGAETAKTLAHSSNTNRTYERGVNMVLV